MKKTYLAPAIFEHKLRVESHILANSPIIKRGVDLGNKDAGQGIGGETPVIEDFHQGNIGVIEGDNVENI
ncbi:MAG: hypothetical protein MJZ32_12655 [Bacteroidaceae bacterium]|nr:hypothetical protein [Bacteroidaceae bacterium]